jgi:hypothetical protein
MYIFIYLANQFLCKFIRQTGWGKAAQNSCLQYSICSSRGSYPDEFSFCNIPAIVSTECAYLVTRLLPQWNFLCKNFFVQPNICISPMSRQPGDVLPLHLWRPAPPSWSRYALLDRPRWRKALIWSFWRYLHCSNCMHLSVLDYW